MSTCLRDCSSLSRPAFRPGAAGTRGRAMRIELHSTRTRSMNVLATCSATRLKTLRAGHRTMRRLVAVRPGLKAGLQMAMARICSLPKLFRPCPKQFRTRPKQFRNATQFTPTPLLRTPKLRTDVAFMTPPDRDMTSRETISATNRDFSSGNRKTPWSMTTNLRQLPQTFEASS